MSPTSDGCLIIFGFVVRLFSAQFRAEVAACWAFENLGLAEMTLPIVVVGDARMGP
jgi:hypothetical protein